MDVTKPYEYIWFGAMDVTQPYEFVRFGAMDVTQPYEFVRFGAMDVTKPYEFIWFGATSNCSYMSCSHIHNQFGPRGGRFGKDPAPGTNLKVPIPANLF
jgi:hypothetical protein